MDKGMGYILETERKKAGLSLKELARGYNSPSKLCRIEMEEQQMDVFLLECLWGRLGKSTDYLECILGEEDYQLYELRYQIEEALKEKNWETAEKKILLYEQQAGNKKIHHRQFIHRSWGILYYEQGEKIRTGQEIEKALRCSMPEFPAEQIWEFPMNVGEMELLILYQRTEERMEESEKSTWLRKLLDKVSKEYEREEQCRIFPKLVLEIQQCDWPEKEKKNYVKEAFSMLRERGAFLNLLEIMKYYLKENKEEDIQKGYNYLRELCLTYGEGERNEVWHHYSEWELYLDYELLQKSRMQKGLSQEEVSEEICNRETLSRIENKRQAVTEKSFARLAGRLGKRQEKYSTFITADSYELSKKERKIGWLLMYHRGKEAERLFVEIEKNKLEDTEENRQYLLMERTLIDECFGKISQIEKMQRMQEALRCTMSEEEIQQLEKSFLTRQETIILNNLACTSYEMGKKEKAIDILKQLRKNYKNSGIRSCYHFKALFPVLGNLASYLEEAGSYEEALEVCEEGIRLALESSKGHILQRFLTTKACVLEDIGKKEESIQLLRRAYYISLLYLDEHTAGLIKEHLQELYQISL